ncbi:MAG: diguanylate cyclase [Sedimenticola sp.]|nr:diguanylate cyclase [Sedimenticola sp.]MCW8974128.1 diguanylate cyclase [Sedimenticola sp.]
MNQPAGEWKKKYFDSLADLERKEKRWESVESALRRSLSRLSFVGDGLDPVLDERLEQLRNRVRGEQDTKALLRLVEDIAAKAEGVQSKRVSDAGSTGVSADQLWLDLFNEAQFPKAFQKQAHKLTKALKQSPIANETIKEAKSLIIEALSQPSSADPGKGKGLIGKLFTKDSPGRAESGVSSGQQPHTAPPQENRIGGQELFISLITQLQSTQRAWEQLNIIGEKARLAASNRELEQLVTDLVEIVSAGDESAAADLLPSADQVLLQLVEQLDITEQLKPRAHALRKQLSRGIIAKDIPVILTELLQLVEHAKTAAENERQEVERFLLQMTEQLQQLDQEVVAISELGGELAEGSHQLDLDMHIQINHLQESVSDATDMNDLKLSITERLSMIQERLRGSRSDTERLVENFEQRIGLLNSRIGDMEQETASLRESVDKARIEAFTDSLTGLNNRHAFDCKLEEEFSRWNRYGSSLSMIVVDVDHFKKVNDTYGHLAGDKVLHVIGTHLKNATRNVDFPARYGGEEFVILLPEVDLKGAMVVAEKIRKAVEEKPFRSGENRVNITVSCGVASFRNGDARKTPFERADEALYLAKRGGRNRCCTEEQVKLDGR